MARLRSSFRSRALLFTFLRFVHSGECLERGRLLAFISATCWASCDFLKLSRFIVKIECSLIENHIIAHVPGEVIAVLGWKAHNNFHGWRMPKINPMMKKGRACNKGGPISINP